MNSEPARRIKVLQGDRAVAAYRTSPLVSSASSWPASCLAEIHRLPPMRVPPAVGLGHGLVVNLGRPITVEWGFSEPCRRVEFPTGGTCVGSPGELIPAFEWKERLNCAVIHLAPQLFANQQTRFRLRADMGTLDPNILKLVRLMQNELSQGAPHGPMFGESVGHQLAVYLDRRYAVRTPVPVFGGLGPYRRRLVFEFLHAYINRPLTLTDLSRLVGLSVFHFSRAFKQEFGLSPYRFLLELRIEQARRMLAQSSLDHAEIGRRLGFSSASHFGRIFRGIAGITPGDFRSQNRRG